VERQFLAVILGIRLALAAWFSATWLNTSFTNPIHKDSPSIFILNPLVNWARGRRATTSRDSQVFLSTSAAVSQFPWSDLMISSLDLLTILEPLAPSLFQTLRWCLSWLLFQLFFLRIASRSCMVWVFRRQFIPFLWFKEAD
jgi:hypothetical protein